MSRSTIFFSSICLKSYSNHFIKSYVHLNTKPKKNWSDKCSKYLQWSVYVKGIQKKIWIYFLFYSLYWYDYFSITTNNNKNVFGRLIVLVMLCTNSNVFAPPVTSNTPTRNEYINSNVMFQLRIKNHYHISDASI